MTCLVEACRGGITLRESTRRVVGREAMIIMGTSRAGAGLGLASLTMRVCFISYLHFNQLTSLPAGIFDKFTTVESL